MGVLGDGLMFNATSQIIWGSIKDFTVIGAFWLAILTYQNTLRVRRFDATLKCIHFYNGSIRAKINAFEQKFDWLISDAEFQTMEVDYYTNSELLATQVLAAKMANIGGLVYELDELGNYVKYKVINRSQLRAAIVSDLGPFLTNPKYAYVIKKIIVDASLESPKDLYELMGVVL